MWGAVRAKARGREQCLLWAAVDGDRPHPTRMCGGAFGCLSSFLPHSCILKMEHTVSVIFSFVVVACF